MISKLLHIHFITREQLDAIREYFNKDGFVIIRGLKLTPIEFEAFTCDFCKEIYDVSSRYHTKPQEGDGLTSYAPIENISILAHSEAAYSPYPNVPNIGF
ncbi:MAG: TauD/TfdA family dioxygenase [Campylobacterales bacterium]|nr:TauD/TfdA family dioxygenase [Campylobacterales bacterium]